MTLAERKQLLLTRSALHRKMIALEYASLGERWKGGLSLAGGGQRWWWLGGLGAALLLTRPGRGVIRWVPTLLAIWRGLKG